MVAGTVDDFTSGRWRSGDSSSIIEATLWESVARRVPAWRRSGDRRRAAAANAMATRGNPDRRRGHDSVPRRGLNLAREAAARGASLETASDSDRESSKGGSLMRTRKLLAGAFLTLGL